MVEYLRLIRVCLHDPLGEKPHWVLLPAVPNVGDKVYVEVKPTEGPSLMYIVEQREFFHWLSDDDTRERVELKVRKVPL